MLANPIQIRKKLLAWASFVKLEMRVGGKLENGKKQKLWSCRRRSASSNKFLARSEITLGSSIGKLFPFVRFTLHPNSALAEGKALKIEFGGEIQVCEEEATGNMRGGDAINSKYCLIRLSMPSCCRRGASGRHPK